MSIKDLLKKAMGKAKTDVPTAPKRDYVPDEVMGRWRISDTDDNEVATLRIITSKNPNFAYDEQLAQVLGEEFEDEKGKKRRKYKNIGFVQPSGAFTPFGSQVDSEEVKLFTVFLAMLEDPAAAEGYTLTEVHRKVATAESSLLGKALLKWQQSKQAKQAVGSL